MKILIAVRQSILFLLFLALVLLVGWMVLGVIEQTKTGSVGVGTLIFLYGVWILYLGNLIIKEPLKKIFTVLRAVATLFF